MRALILDATLRKSPSRSRTGTVNAERALERMDAMLAESRGDGTPVACNRDWTHSTGNALASTLVHAARALQASPTPAPPGS